MSEAAEPHELLTVEEYYALEETSSVRHEYVGGFIHAMTGATRRHNRIIGNIYRKLADAANGGACRVYTQSVKLRVADDTIYYPDLMVCGGDEPEDDYTEYDPCLVIEVVSASTETTDHREKLLAYRKLPNPKMYVIVEQERRVVERHWRDDDGKWLQAVQSEEGSFDVPFPEVRLSLSEIYEGVRETR